MNDESLTHAGLLTVQTVDAHSVLRANDATLQSQWLAHNSKDYDDNECNSATRKKCYPIQVPQHSNVEATERHMMQCVHTS